MPAAKDGVGGEVQEFLGHTDATFGTAIAANYARDPTREFWNGRVAREYARPKFSDTSAYVMVRKPVSNEKISEWQKVEEPLVQDRDSRAAKTRARINVRRQRHLDFLAAAEQASGSKKSSTSPYQLSSSRRKEPASLDESTLESIQVDSKELENFQAKVFQQEVSDDDAKSEDDSTQNDQDGGTEDFIANYAAINVVNRPLFTRSWSLYADKSLLFEESIGLTPCGEIPATIPLPWCFFAERQTDAPTRAAF